MRVIAIVGIIVGIAAALAPWPLPIDTSIAAAPISDKPQIEFHWRPAGLLGLSGDNPWVYAVAIDPLGQQTILAKVWADSPCDGVARLSQQLSVARPECSDAL